MFGPDVGILTNFGLDFVGAVKDLDTEDASVSPFQSHGQREEGVSPRPWMTPPNAIWWPLAGFSSMESTSAVAWSSGGRRI